LILIAVLGISAYLISQRRLPTTLAWKPTHDLPIYHLITDTDVMTTTVTLSSLSKDALPAQTSPVGLYTRQSVTANAVLRSSYLVGSSDLTLTHDTVPVPISATAAMALSGQLKPGTVVALWSISPPDQANPITVQPLFQRILVLDVQQNTLDAGEKEQASSEPFVIVLAVPPNHQADVLAAAASHQLALTLAP
jgi:Flp pilus assembly protein CpaB